MLWRIRRVAVWLSRVHLCRGFGIQSPWAYSFVRYVINEHYPYYGYGDVERDRADLHPLRVMLGRLCLRIANYTRAAHAVCCGCAGDALSMYLRAGSNRVEITDIGGAAADDEVSRALSGVETVDMLWMRPGCGGSRLLKECTRRAREDSVFVIEGIKSDAAARRLWREEVARLEGVITFDLYYCGVVCFKSRLISRSYVVNF